MISYYDLLGMIKNKTQPKQIKYHDKIYIWGYSNYVYIDDNAKYLVANINEINMFDKTIEIIEEDKDIEDLETTTNNSLIIMETYVGNIKKALDWNFNVLENKIIELIKEVNKLRKEEIK